MPVRKCPKCGEPLTDPKAPHRPFCSWRCKLVDLGAWLAGQYRLGGEKEEEEGQEEDRGGGNRPLQ